MSMIHHPSFVLSKIWKRLMWRFSVAAAAIHFFKSVPQNTCLRVRNVVLHEDRTSVARPECHVLGLIPFCLKTPQLHIERRVNMWRNVLTAGSIDSEYDHYDSSDTSLFERLLAGDEDTQNVYGNVRAIQVGVPFGKWITETSALFTNGMPIHSFSLVFEGDPAPDQSSVLFETVKISAA